MYEAFARHWAPRGLAAIPDSQLDRLAELGFEYLWLMGVWTTGVLGRDLARRAFSSHPAEAIDSSPYAIARYEVDPRLGGDDALIELRGRLAKRGIKLILDFVPNHTARDHDWIQSNPEIYVTDDSGIACGKDPYFPAWTDTAQLDHRLASTRHLLLDTLATIAEKCDGVRCDMAMLVLSDVFAKTWAHAPERGPHARGEFWAEAIDSLPEEFVWIAEAYWGLEGRLQQLGFDYTYDKALYDHLVHGNAAQIRADLAAPFDYQRRSVRFLENHDEPRLARTLAPDQASAALAIALTAPGMRFVHDGQIEGNREQAVIQLVSPPPEATRLTKRTLAHEPLLALGRTPALRDGSFLQLAADDGRLVAHRWDHPDGAVVVIVNYSPERVQSHVTLDLHGAAGRTLQLRDVMANETYERDGSARLFVDLRPWQAHVFTVKTAGLWYG